MSLLFEDAERLLWCMWGVNIRLWGCKREEEKDREGKYMTLYEVKCIDFRGISWLCQENLRSRFASRWPVKKVKKRVSLHLH